MGFCSNGLIFCCHGNRIVSDQNDFASGRKLTIGCIQGLDCGIRGQTVVGILSADRIQIYGRNCLPRHGLHRKKLHQQNHQHQQTQTSNMFHEYSSYLSVHFSITIVSKNMH